MKTARLAACAASFVSAAVVPVASAEIAFGVTQQQRLISFNTATPGTLSSGFAISGLAANEQVVGIDVRPNDGFLYALGSQNNLYRLNTSTGAATLVSPLSIPLNGGNFGIDFNPTGPVALRIVSNTDKNYRVTDPGTGGSVTQDTDLAYIAGDANFGVNPNVTHVAYTNSVAGATSTVLYGIDAGTDTLVRFNSPNGGTLSTVGVFGVGGTANINVIGGFDIFGPTGNAFAATQDVSLSISTLWKIDLATGAGVNLGEIGGGETLVAFTMVPSPASAALLCLGVVTLTRRRR